MSAAFDTGAATFSPEHIRSEWQPLDWQARRPASAGIAEYTRFYGINFVETGEAARYGFGWLAAAGEHLAAHIWWPAKPSGTTLVCHGYMDHVGLYRHVIRDLLELNQVVVAYDLPGHGLSTGAPVSIDSFLRYVEALDTCVSAMAGQVPRPWHLLAQSTGAAVAMDMLLHRRHEDIPFEQAILLAPLVRPVKWPHVKLLHFLVSPFRNQVKRIFTANSNDPDFVDFLEYSDPLQSRVISVPWVAALKDWLKRFRQAPPSRFTPVVIQGDQDDTVDWRYNLPVIRRKFHNPHVHMLEGAFHHLANESLPYRQEIRRLLDQYLNPRH